MTLETLKILLVVGSLLLSFSGCKSSPPLPGDQKLIDMLNREIILFQALAQDPDNSELHAKLGVIRHRPGSGEVFVMAQKDLPGPGGYAKGYYYSTAPPAKVVADTDVIHLEHGSEEGEFYRHIQGPWYIYYSAAN